MADHKVVVVGASAGGLEALLKMVKDLPPDLPAAVLIVVHSSPNFPSLLPELLTRAGPLPAVHAADGVKVRAGRIYVAPPNRHLLLNDGEARLPFGPKVNGFRPAIDPLFRSAVHVYRGATIGVILSGGMTDGVAGLLMVKEAGGLTVVQDPADAAVPELPRNALAVVAADHTAPASELGTLLGRLARTADQTRATTMPDTLTRAEEATRKEFGAQQRGERAGHVSLFSCPACGGVMRQTDETRLAEFLCHVGHYYEGEALLAAQAETIETTAWGLLRALKERALLARELAGLARGRGDGDAEARLTGTADEADQHITLLEERLGKSPPR